MAKTLLTMRTEARRLADMENSTFVSDAELDIWINEGISDLYDKLISVQGQEYYRAEVSVALVPGTAVYTVTGLYKVLQVEVPGTVTDEPEILEPYHLRNRHAGTGTSWSSHHKNRRYRLFGEVASDGTYTQRIRFRPTPDRSENATLVGIPPAPTLSSGSDVWDGFNGWETYPILFTAIRALDKEESDSSAFRADLARLEQRINTLGQEVDMGHGGKIIDVEGFFE